MAVFWPTIVGRVVLSQLMHILMALIGFYIFPGEWCTLGLRAYTS